ncbi:hypothetical protein JOF59_004550 [Streptomyces clavifer]|uniref:Uncharacterized protein n=1 Tax=Streptomyces clavifer TaxID=68188 RepID=A0ABS4VDZ9_9ACTN|nr:hypothetical protein [Streptomyces clavifer]
MRPATGCAMPRRRASRTFLSARVRRLPARGPAVRSTVDHRHGPLPRPAASSRPCRTPAARSDGRPAQGTRRSRAVRRGRGHGGCGCDCGTARKRGGTVASKARALLGTDAPGAAGAGGDPAALGGAPVRGAASEHGLDRSAPARRSRGRRAAGAGRTRRRPRSGWRTGRTSRRPRAADPPDAAAGRDAPRHGCARVPGRRYARCGATRASGASTAAPTPPRSQIRNLTLRITAATIRELGGCPM